MSSEQPGKRILVTGGAGFIGGAVVRHLVAHGWKVTNLDCLTYAGTLQSLVSVEDEPNYRFIRADICDGVAVRAAIAEARPEAIMHLAAESHVDRSIDGPAAFVQTNIVGTYVLLEAATDYWKSLEFAHAAEFRFHHVSTDEVFGSLDLHSGEPFSESTPYDPSSPYSATKAAADHLVRAWHRTFGLPVLVSNCSNNYGPFHFPEKLIPLTILNAIEGKPLKVYGKGENVRDWLFVEDHARALERIISLGLPGSTYNVGGNAERSNLSVVEQICDLVDERLGKDGGRSRRRLITYVTDRPGHDLRYAIDISKIKRELGWSPQESFESGLTRTVEWYLANDWWWRPLRDNNYAGQRLGIAQ